MGTGREVWEVESRGRGARPGRTVPVSCLTSVVAALVMLVLAAVTAIGGLIGLALLFGQLDFQSSEERACPNSTEAPIAAAANGSFEQVRAALAAGWEPNTRDDGNNTALTCAVPQGHVRIVEVLLAAGADPNTVARDGDSVLSDAARFCMSGITRLLLDAGADPESIDRIGLTPLAQSVDLNDVSTAVVLLEASADPGAIAHAPADRAFSAERGSRCPADARFGDQMGSALLEHGVDPGIVLNRAVNDDRSTLVQNALDAGADPDVGSEPLITSDTYSWSFTPPGPRTRRELSASRFPVQRLLVLEGPGDPVADDPLPIDAVQEAIGTGSVHAWKRPPLLLAAWRGDEAMVRLLLDAGADPNAQSAGGYTALHAAAVAGHDDITALLVEAGAVPPDGVIAPEDLAARVAPPGPAVPPGP